MQSMAQGSLLKQNFSAKKYGGNLLPDLLIYTIFNIHCRIPSYEQLRGVELERQFDKQHER